MKQLETDIAIVGSGTAGLAAAIAAAEKGAKVIAFEKASTTGGTGNMGMGPFAVESRLQRMKNITLTREEAFKIFMDYTHWRVDARLVSNYINKSADTIDWLEKMGVVFGGVEAYVRGSYPTHHQVAPPGGHPGTPMASGAMMKCMTDKAAELGVKIHLQTTVKKLIKEKGKITGMIAEDRNGETIQANTKAVIIATGGFGNNPDMIKKYTEYEWGKDLFSMRIPGMVGEGIRMAWEVGAAAEGMNMELICMPGMPTTAMAERITDSAAMSAAMFSPVTPAFSQPNLMVNLLGQRFMNEAEMGNTTFLANAVARQKNRCAFIILDGATAKHYVENGWDWPSAMRPSVKIDDFDAEAKKVIEQGNDGIFAASSLDELASKTGINADGLKETVEEYNKACETGRDEIFHKRSAYLRPVKQPNFYAGRAFPGAYGSLGGIKINHRTEVITEEFDIIPGLYAAGTDACSIYADSYVFILCGNTMGFALNSGRMAGENAADYAKSIAK
jgi:fumarate reductase flavoprotein subunit